MAYSELIKNFEKIRDYIQQFYIYGFKSRTEYDGKSSRSYDNERRRIESWLEGYVKFRKDADGKRVYLSIDSRTAKQNPLFQVLKTKSFTTGDITLHFYILDLLCGEKSYTAKEITDLIFQEYLCYFEEFTELEESSVRKKLAEYVKIGILKTHKQGKKVFYSRNENNIDLSSWADALAFYTEDDPIGVIGSFLLDKCSHSQEIFRFKHHYILNTLDSIILYRILTASEESKNIEIEVKSLKTGNRRKHLVFPLNVYISTQNGRRYLACYHFIYNKIVFYRLDSIISVKAEKENSSAEEYKECYKNFKKHLWGVATSGDNTVAHIEMTIHVNDNEKYVADRLYREKRCGTVQHTGNNTYLFTADVYDATEMLPWIRTFIGRIEKFECTDKTVIEKFYNDIEEMSKLYGGDDGAV